MDRHPSTGEPAGRPNGRNGHGARTILSGTRALDPQVPRDRLGGLDRQRTAKNQHRIRAFAGTRAAALRR